MLGLSLQEFDLRQMMDGIWHAMVGLRATRSGRATTEQEQVAASVTIRGAWCGRVVLQCDVELARTAAASLLSQAPTACMRPDLEDAACELVNMAAGGVKALAIGTCDLSIPKLVATDDLHPQPGEEEFGSWRFACGEHSFALHVYAAPPQAGEQPAG